MATKSLVIQTGIDLAKKAHNCQANARHRIKRGDVRLKVRNGRSWVHYCRECAGSIIAKSIEKLKALQSMQPQEDQED